MNQNDIHGEGSYASARIRGYQSLPIARRSPIASATNEKQLADLAEAAKLKLDAESIQKLNAVSAQKVAAEALDG